MAEMSEQLVEAGVLLAVGMSVVFAFLTLLIAGIHAIAWFCRKFPSEAPVPNVLENRAVRNNTVAASVSPQIAAAIAAAVHTHRHTTLKS